jgi:hypothetical protein
MARTDLGYYLLGQHDKVPLYERLIKWQLYKVVAQPCITDGDEINAEG